MREVSQRMAELLRQWSRVKVGPTLGTNTPGLAEGMGPIFQLKQTSATRGCQSAART